MFNITQRPITNEIKFKFLTPNIIYYTLLPRRQPLCPTNVAYREKEIFIL